MPAKLHRRARLRRPLALLALLLAVLAGGHAALWAWLAARLESEVGRWAAERRAAGWEISHGPPRRTGWPLEVALDLPDVVLRAEGLAWQAARVRLALAAPELDRLRITAEGAQRLGLAGGSAPLATAGLHASLRIGPGAAGPGGLPREAALRAEMLHLDLPSGPLRVEGLRLDLASSAVAGPEEAMVLLRAEALAVALPPDLAAAPGLALLGPALRALRLEAAATGPWPGLAGPAAVRAARWRDGGGVVELRGVALNWGPVEANGSAVLAFDEALQPAGAGTLALVGAADLLRAAQAAGLVGRRDAAGAQLLLAMLQRRPPAGGPPRLDLPVALEAQGLTLGGVPLARLPRWHWAVPRAGPRG